MKFSGAADPEEDIRSLSTLQVSGRQLPSNSRTTLLMTAPAWGSLS